MTSIRGLSWPKKLLWFCIFVVGFELLYLLFHVPTIFSLKSSVPQSSAFIDAYESRRAENSSLPKIKFNPKDLNLSRKQKLPFIVAEDSRFHSHFGIDPQAFYDAMKYNWKAGKFALGASTISQQTAKNLFLSPSRNPIRKWHELLLTLSMEALLDKKDILNAYLSVAEFGKGLYGVHAAASHYFQSDVHNLSQRQMVLLAASLPSPKKSNPATRSRFFNKRVSRIQATIDRYYAKPTPQPRKTLEIESENIEESSPLVEIDESEAQELEYETIDKPLDASTESSQEMTLNSRGQSELTTNRDEEEENSFSLDSDEEETID